MGNKNSVYTYPQIQKMQALRLEYKINAAKHFIRETCPEDAENMVCDIALGVSAGWEGR